MIFPGIVNAHSHLEYSRYAGFGDGQPFGPWIATHAARKNLLDDEAMLALARQGVLDSLRSGITTTADYSFSGVAATAAAELGLRAIVYIEVFALEPAAAEQRFVAKRAQIEEAPLVRIGVSPHAPYTCSVDVYRWCLGLGIPVGTHLAESANENEWLEHGTGPLRAIAPILVPPTGRAPSRRSSRCSGPTSSAPTASRSTTPRSPCSRTATCPVAHCPRSNALLGCGVAPLTALRDAGVRVGLGTDSPASAPSFDAFEEMRAAVYAARAREKRPEALLRPTRFASRRSTPRGRCGWTTRWVP